MPATLLRPSTETIERRRVRRRVLSSGLWRDSRALPYTEGQAVVAPGAIGPALVRRGATSPSDT